MSEAQAEPLLARFEGAQPDRPPWFSAALAHRPERTEVMVLGAAIETLTWGEVGQPGLLLLHGKMAHADWWSFLAPFFAGTHRVAAMSFAGMGGSGWRDDYVLDTMVDEVMSVAQAAGLFEASVKPLIVGHSFGGFTGLRCAELFGDRLAGLVTVDVPLQTREQRRARTQPSIRNDFVNRPTRVYPTQAAALARFRFAPEQPCDQLYIVDHIARTSLREAAMDDGGPGWTWRFDPRVALIAPGQAAHSLRHAACPVAVTWGADSKLVDAGVVEHVTSLLPPGASQIAIPAAHHHVMVDQPLAFVTMLRGLFAAWPPQR